MRDIRDNPPLMFALAVGVPLGIVATGYAVKIVLEGFGIAIAIASAGEALGDYISVWATRTAAAGIGLAGASIALSVTVNVRESIENKPLGWVVPLFAILAGLLVELDREFYEGQPITKILFAAFAALLIFVGGVVFERTALIWKIAGLALMIMPPFIILLSLVSGSTGSNVIAALNAVPVRSWLTIGGVTALALMVLVLALFSTDKV